MLAEKYQNDFLSINKNNELKAVMNQIVEKEQKFNRNCTEWTTDQVKELLRDLHYETPNTICRALSFFKNFVNWICNKEQIQCPEFEFELGILYDLVDLDKVLSSTITYEQFRHIYNQLDENPRDRCLIGLPWHCMLSSDEIKNIKESDIVFDEDEDGMKIAWITISVSDNKKVKVEDWELVDDLKKCLDTSEYIKETKDDKIKKMKLRDTQYLIKPTVVGPTGKEETISNPSIALHKVLENKDITCPGIDVLSLNISNIRRSKIIYLLAPQNERYFDNELIMHYLDAGNIESNLFWLKKIAVMKYKKDE